METKEQLIHNLKIEIIETLGLMDINAEMINNDDLIFGGEGVLELDSLDALELIMIIERSFGLKIQNKNKARKILTSFNSLGEYILENASEEKVQAYLELS